MDGDPIRVHDDERVLHKLRRHPCDRGVQPSDIGHENGLRRGELAAGAAAAQFYAFACRCMDWARTTRSLQERVVYSQMGLQWLAAGARLQTFLQFRKAEAAQSSEATTEPRRIGRAPLSPGTWTQTA